jgi:hypothetical protein
MTRCVAETGEPGSSLGTVGFFAAAQNDGVGARLGWPPLKHPPSGRGGETSNLTALAPRPEGGSLPGRVENGA